MVKIRFWNRYKHCFDVTELSEKDWNQVIQSCKLSGIPLNAEVISNFK